MTAPHPITIELMRRGWPAAAAARIAEPDPQDAEPNRSLTIRRIAASFAAPWDVTTSLELTVCSPAELAVMLQRVVGKSTAMTPDQCTSAIVWCAQRAGRRPS